MNFLEFKRYNTIVGWCLFLVSALVYIFTMETSSSFWDCGEFIAACYKLQVVHPPGAPLFLLIGRFFSMFAFGNELMVSVMLNLMSALCSAFAMLFLFWIITHMGKRIYFKATESISKSSAIAILGAGFVGALVGTFCDSIWFSAVEAEVYSMSLFFTALVVWLMCKWDEQADEPYADRWLILILFMMGCSIGVHWLNLLTIPALSFLYYLRRYKPTILGLGVTALISVLLLGFIMKVVIVGLATMANSLELAFVNDFGLPFNSGVIFFILLLVGLILGGLWFTRKSDYTLAHNLIIAFSMLMIGFSTIAVTVIRANADPPINMNDPKDMPSLLSFLNREQYGSRPLLNGQMYYSKVVGIEDTGVIWEKEGNKYVKVGKKFKYKYNPKETVFFPRMHSDTPDHVRRYKNWVGLRGSAKPTFGDNLEFFFKYQLGWMYWRYFGWNFIGRQNDNQGFKGPKDGNYLSGIGFLDNMRLGDQSQLSDYRKNNHSRNTFFFIPLILALLGIVFHTLNDRNRAFFVFVLFVSTGIMLIVYGNSPPTEPRERDYIFAGSFWAFSIWAGLGVLGIYELLKKYLKGNAAYVAIAIAAIAPILMGTQGWNDHDRSDRPIARDFARNYLESCEKNAILFTQGDNDTYPLWYAQEVENIRPDVRIVNLSLLGVDWYIDQMRKANNTAKKVDFVMNPKKYRGDSRNFIAYSEDNRIAPKDRHINLIDVVNFMASDDNRNKRQTSGGGYRNYYPTKKLAININKDEIIKNNVVLPEDRNKIVDRMQWQIPKNKNNLLKNDIMTLDIIAKNAQNGWKRPIYFAISINPESFLGLDKYFQLEGFTYRLVPIEAGNQGGYKGRIAPSIMYDNLMNKFTFGNLDRPGVATDETIRRMASNLRGNFARLAEVLTEKGENKKAKDILDKGTQMLPNENIPFDFFTLFTVESYFSINEKDSAMKIAKVTAENLLQDMEFIKSLGSDRKPYERDYQLALMGMQRLMSLAQQNERNAWVQEIKPRFDKAQIPGFGGR